MCIDTSPFHCHMKVITLIQIYTGKYVSLYIFEFVISMTLAVSSFCNAPKMSSALFTYIMIAALEGKSKSKCQ